MKMTQTTSARCWFARVCACGVASAAGLLVACQAAADQPRPEVPKPAPSVSSPDVSSPLMSAPVVTAPVVLPGSALVIAPAVEPKANPATQPVAVATSVKIRVATFNLEDVRTEDLVSGNQPRLRSLASIIQRVRPNVILLNEIAYDTPGVPGFNRLDYSGVGVAEKPRLGLNGQRFADKYLAVAQAEGLLPIRYRAFMEPSNTGVHSGFDLDNDGVVTPTYPEPPPSTKEGDPGEQTAEGRLYGNDCWGFGTFPGQYAMALLVDERLVLDAENARTFQLLPWDYMSGNFMPSKADGTPWYDAEETKTMPMSSKSHWDVPVRMPNGSVVHMLCSHPTPPGFDAVEMRNKKRNHDEIRFWADYLDNAAYVIDDSRVQGGLAKGAHFVILGDLNADPDEGSSYKDPIDNLLVSHPRINGGFVPTSDVAIDKLDADDTAMFRLRVDYVLPSKTLEVEGGAVERAAPPKAYKMIQRGQENVAAWPSDHFLVWLDVVVPAPVLP